MSNDTTLVPDVFPDRFIPAEPPAKTNLADEAAYYLECEGFNEEAAYVRQLHRLAKQIFEAKSSNRPIRAAGDLIDQLESLV
jgi:hypothetical protein